MENVLTAGIAAMYPNAKIEVKYGISRIRGIDFDRELIHTCSENGLMDVVMKAEHCKLILTPLAYISDLDAIEVCKMAGNNSYDDAYKARQGRDLANQYWRRQTNLTARDWVDIINYLRSKSYDVDNLIQSGIAITTKTP